MAMSRKTKSVGRVTEVHGPVVDIAYETPLLLSWVRAGMRRRTQP
jgi:hypothetical protein